MIFDITPPRCLRRGNDFAQFRLIRCHRAFDRGRRIEIARIERKSTARIEISRILLAHLPRADGSPEKIDIEQIGMIHDICVAPGAERLHQSVVRTVYIRRNVGHVRITVRDQVIFEFTVFERAAVAERFVSRIELFRSLVVIETFVKILVCVIFRIRSCRFHAQSRTRDGRQHNRRRNH